MKNQIRVLTYNIHKGYASGNRRFVLDAMRARLVESAADLVFLQEVHGSTFGRKRKRAVGDYPEEPHFEYLADQTWPHFAYGRNAVYRSGDHGNAILSRYPIIQSDNVDFSRFPRSSRSILHCVIDVPNALAPLHAICIHMGLLERERRFQCRVLADHIDQHVPKDEPLVIAGDFNDWRRRVDTELENYLEVDELFMAVQGRHARTFPVWAPVLSVDRIYYRNLAPISGSRLCNGAWRQLSDHAALLGNFSMQ